MKTKLFLSLFALSAFLLLNFIPIAETQEDSDVALSEETVQCIECHAMFNPGIVADWRASRHARTTPAGALAKDASARRISAESVPEAMSEVAVGCYECHGQNTDAHADSFEHEGFEINVIVSPNDCATCHPVERDEYADSKKAHAYGNLMNNPVYHTLVETTLGVQSVEEGKITQKPSTLAAQMDACFACHGTEVKVDGTRTVETAYGPMEFVNLVGWPNQGVGRINPDGSLGSCAACHTRHAFSIEMARKPWTCQQCHLEPDVPAWDVYRESKHGNIYLSMGDQWNWDAVPWTIGKDFKAPTCAVCHSAEIVTADGEKIAERSHDFGARLWVRIFGLIYSHPQPKSGDTTVIRNADGLPLPTTFTGQPASEYLIDAEEQAARRDTMKKVCVGCHGTSWAENYFAKMDAAIAEADAQVAVATQLMAHAWEAGLADKTNPFDEPLERKWVQQWLFYANSLRYASAMSGPDLAAFERGWWQLTKNVEDIKHDIELMSAGK